MSRLTIAGIGPGSPGYVMPEALCAMREAGTVIAAKRILPMLRKQCGDRTAAEFVPMGRIARTLSDIDGLLEEGQDVVLAVSGDPLMYSLLRTIQKDPVSAGWTIRILPGIGSLQMLGAAIGQTMEEACVISVHGRNRNPGEIALAVTEHPAVFFLCGKDQNPAWLARIMMEYHLDHVTVTGGSNLSYPEEEIVSGTPAEIAGKAFPDLCVAAITNPAPRKVTRPRFLSDGDFERGKTPMTKEEIRVLILHKLALEADDVIWDIGAGTGSVSIECARQAPFGSVHSVERDAAAAALILKNKEKFHTDHLTIYQGTAAQRLSELPRPDKVFVGGSGGQLGEILEAIAAFHADIRVVVSAVTLETIAETEALLTEYDPDYDVIQATVGRGRRIGSYHIVDTNNPVMLFTAVI